MPNRDSKGNIRYKRNPNPSGLVPYRQIQDDITGAWTTEEKLVTNFFGERQDPRMQKPDSSDFRFGGGEGPFTTTAAVVPVTTNGLLNDLVEQFIPVDGGGGFGIWQGQLTGLNTSPTAGVLIESVVFQDGAGLIADVSGGSITTSVSLFPPMTQGWCQASVDTVAAFGFRVHSPGGSAASPFLVVGETSTDGFALGTNAIATPTGTNNLHVEMPGSDNNYDNTANTATDTVTPDAFHVAWLVWDHTTRKLYGIVDDDAASVSVSNGIANGAADPSNALSLSFDLNVGGSGVTVEIFSGTLWRGTNIAASSAAGRAAYFNGGTGLSYVEFEA